MCSCRFDTKIMNGIIHKLIDTTTIKFYFKTVIIKSLFWHLSAEELVQDEIKISFDTSCKAFIEI